MCAVFWCKNTDGWSAKENSNLSSIFFFLCFTDGQQRNASRNIFIFASIICHSWVSGVVRKFIRNGMRRTPGSWQMRFKFSLHQTAPTEGKYLLFSGFPWWKFNDVWIFQIYDHREYYRATSATPKRHDQTVRTANYNRNNGAHLSNEINPAEVLANRDAAVQNKLRRNKKQQTNREHKSLRLSGNVDLGNNVFKQRKSMKRKKVQKTLTTTTNTPTATTEHPNFISQVFHPSNHHRHNHNAAERQLTHKGTTQSPKAMTSTPSIAITSTLRYPTTTLITNIEPQSTTSIQIVAKQLEKVPKRIYF